jgi:hypothetical protein
MIEYLLSETAEDSNSTYHSFRNHLSASSLADISSKGIRNFMLGNGEDVDFEDIASKKKDYTFGTAFHTKDLEPDKFDYLDLSQRPLPNKDFKTKVNQEWKSANEGKIVDIAKINRMFDNLRSNYYGNAVANADYKTELSHYGRFKYKDVELPFKIRPDRLVNDKSFYVSLKTTKCITPLAYMRDAGNLLYHLKEAFYLDLLSQIYPNIDTCLMLVCSTGKVPQTWAIKMKKDSVEHLAGRMLYEKAIDNYINYQNDNKFDTFVDYSVQNGLLDFTLPHYFTNNF